MPIANTDNTIAIMSKVVFMLFFEIIANSKIKTDEQNSYDNVEKF